MADLGRGNLSAPLFRLAIDHRYAGLPSVVGYLQGLALLNWEAAPRLLKSISNSGTATYSGDGRSIPKHLSVGVSRSNSEGDPGQPSLLIAYPGMWRFRWLVQAGSRTITIRVKQAANAAPYPSIVVKANTACGVNSDVTGTSAGGAGWVTIGPVSVSPSSSGSLWVELWNNYNLASDAPAYFDHIVVT